MSVVVDTPAERVCEFCGWDPPPPPPHAHALSLFRTVHFFGRLQWVERLRLSVQFMQEIARRHAWLGPVLQSVVRRKVLGIQA